METKIQDLDVLRPKPKFITLGGNKIDVSFIPCGITWDIDRIVRELSSMSQDEILQNGDTTKRAFELTIEMCSTFCCWQYPELTEEWFMKNCNATQIKAFSKSIQEALQSAYKGIDSKPKNAQAPRKKPQ